MTQHLDILDQSEPLRRGFMQAVFFHVTMFALYGIYSLVNTHVDTGSKDAGSGAIGIEVTNAIPIAHSGHTNPVANPETESEVPQEPVKPTPQPKKLKEKISPKAVALKLKDKLRPADTASEKQKYRSFKELDKNQVFAKQAPQIANPMFTAAPGSGNIGTNNTTFGNSYAAYGAQVQSVLARAWVTGGIDAGVSSAPPMIASFDIQRDGSVRNARLLQSSGLAALDNSVKRAMEDARFPPLPAGFPKDSAHVEFTFEFKR